MTTQLTAVFDDRDGADLALMRLRRNGIEYSIAELRAPDRRSGADMPLLSMSPSYGLALSEGISAGMTSSFCVSSSGAGSSPPAIFSKTLRSFQWQRLSIR